MKAIFDSFKELSVSSDASGPILAVIGAGVEKYKFDFSVDKKKKRKKKKKSSNSSKETDGDVAKLLDGESSANPKNNSTDVTTTESLFLTNKAEKSTQNAINATATKLCDINVAATIDAAFGNTEPQDKQDHDQKNTELTADSDSSSSSIMDYQTTGTSQSPSAAVAAASFHTTADNITALLLQSVQQLRLDVAELTRTLDAQHEMLQAIMRCVGLNSSDQSKEASYTLTKST